MDTFKNLQKKISAALQSASAHVGELRRSIKAKRAEIDDLEQTPASRDEIQRLVRARIAIDGEAGISKVKYALFHLPHSVGRAGQTDARRVRFPKEDLMSWDAFCAADPGAAEGLVMALVDRAGVPFGLPHDERIAQLDALRNELTEIERTEEALIDEAIAAGVNITHRPDVIRRRADEARRLELEEERGGDRLARQKAIDTAYVRRSTDAEPPRSTAVSPYLTGGSSRRNL